MNNKPSLISVVVLNYNGINYLKKTIEPLLNLEYPNYEIVIVDNKSTDESLTFLNKFKQIKVITNSENLGYSKGKNIGVRNAKGEYILMIDNDVLVQGKGILSQLLDLYKKDDTTGLIQVPLLDVGGSKTRHYGLYYSIYGVNSHQKPVDIDDILNDKSDFEIIGSPTGGCIFFKKGLWDTIGGFDESQRFNIDDVDIGPQVSLLGYKSLLFTKSYFLHLGVNNAVPDSVYVTRFKLIFSGHARSMIKNYKLVNLLIRFPLLYIFSFFKALKYSIKRMNFRILGAFFYSNYFFLRNLMDTLNQRATIQVRRIEKEDLFLKAQPPKFGQKI